MVRAAARHYHGQEVSERERPTYTPSCSESSKELGHTNVTTN